MGKAPGAMTTGRRQHFAEVGAEPRHLAAMVRRQLQHLAQTRQFAPFTVESTGVKGLRHGVEVTRQAQPAEAVAYAFGFHLQPLLRGQVVKRPHDPFTRRTGGLDSAFQIEV